MKRKVPTKQDVPDTEPSTLPEERFQGEVEGLDGQVVARASFPKQYLLSEILAVKPTSEADATAADKRTARLANMTWYSGAAVRRYGWDGPFMLSFSMKPGDIRMGRIQSGNAPILNAHSDYSIDDVLGVIESAEIKNGKGTAKVRFATDDELADRAWNKIEQGILRNVSMGAIIHKLQKTSAEDAKPVCYLAIDWEPCEVSIVPIGADASAMIQNSESQKFTLIDESLVEEHTGVVEVRAISPKENKVEKTPLNAGESARTDAEVISTAAAAAPVATQVAAAAAPPVDTNAVRLAERLRITELGKVGRAAKLTAELVAQHVEAGTSLEKFREIAINAMADASDVGGEIEAHRPLHIAVDAADKMRESMVAGVLLRHSPQMFKDCEERGRQYASYQLVDLARECLETIGVSTRSMSRSEIAAAALNGRISHREKLGGGYATTSDFPNILAQIAGKTLRRGYELAPRTFLPFCTMKTVPNFKLQTSLQTSDISALEKVNEHGEFHTTTITEGKETYQIVTYGNMVNFTRQVIVNDDLNALASIPAKLGAAAARRENIVVWGLITANAAMNDTFNLFSSDHANLQTGAGSALGVTGLAGARTAMRIQTAPKGGMLNLIGKFMLVPAALELTAEQLTNPMGLLTPTLASTVPAWMRQLTPIVEPLLDANSSAYWYLAADPALIDGIVYVYLEGQQGVNYETEQGFEIDGTKFRARHDFGAGVIEYRGLSRNNGA